jgi:3-hydroxyisobutyrate dehydrogenase-like beta-hydroxyacid dehydrogenase
MGSALARAFLGKGYVTYVWNRTPARCAPLASLGARVAPSPEQAVAACDVVVVNVIDYEAADGLLRSPSVAAALEGKLLVQLTSGSPDQAREAAAWAAERGAAYLDGAIMATPNIIGDPAATILYSGRRQAFEANEPVFRALGGNPVHVGEDPGHASALDGVFKAAVARGHLRDDFAALAQVVR